MDINRVVRWLFGQRQTKGALVPNAIGKARSNVVRMPRRRTGCLDTSEFTERLRELSQEEAAEDLHLHIFSLSDFRQATENKWDRLQKLIPVAMDAIARRHIDLNKDIYTQISTETSCLVVPSDDRAMAQTRVENINKEVTKLLFGDATIAGRKPVMIVAQVPLPVALDAHGELNHPAINSAIEKARAAALSNVVQLHPTQPEQASEIGSLTGEGQTSTLEEPVWFEAPLKKLSEAPEEIATNLAAMDDLSLMWSPTWVTAQKGVEAFRAQIYRTASSKSKKYSGSRAYQTLGPMETLILDRFVAKEAALALKDLYFTSKRTGLVVPFHWTSQAVRWRDITRMPLMACPAQARQKLLKIELFGLTDSMPTRTLDAIFEPMQAMGCDIMARIGLNDLDLISRLNHVKAVGLDLSEVSDVVLADEPRLLRQLSKFQQAAMVRGLACYIIGVDSRTVIAHAVRSGYSFVSGLGIMGDVARPVLVKRTQKVA